jgi:hypothetical protein
VKLEGSVLCSEPTSQTTMQNKQECKTLDINAIRQLQLICKVRGNKGLILYTVSELKFMWYICIQFC